MSEEPVPRAGRFGQALAATVPVLIGVASLVYALSLGLGSARDPGPGLWPAMVSVLLMLAAVWSMVSERRDGTAERFTRGARDIGLGILSLIGYGLLFRRIGFEIPTVLLLAFWLKLLGRESWLLTTLVSVVTTAAFYLLFVVLLGVPLPRLAVG